MPDRAVYLDYICAAGATTEAYLTTSVERWRESFAGSDGSDHPLFGYAATGAPAAAAAVDAFLYEATGDLAHAHRARRALLLPRSLTEIFPQALAARHPEYHQAVPPMDGLFVPPSYIPAYERVRGSGIFSEADQREVASIVADSLHTLFHFPEWGAHNRAMLRALSLALAARAFPTRPEAEAWRMLADQLADDSWGRWSIEDAMGYHAIWLLALFTYAEVTGRPGFFELPATWYYVNYFAHMLSPLDTFPDFGDCNWGGGAERLLPCFERAATVYRNPAFKHVADRMAQRLIESGPPSVGNATLFIQAYAWADDSVPSQCPIWGTEELLDDLVGKKVLFRSGWDPDATYMLLNYRDELGYGMIPRRYLRTTLAVSAEKMHHGHADENAIVMLMHKGAVLLHDGGYRENVPNGRYRADIYHNRVILRQGIKPAATSAWDYLHDDGSYKPVSTEKLHFVQLDGVDLSRTRVTDAARGIVWDRVVAYLRVMGCFVIVDGLRAQGIRTPETGAYTFANTLYTSEVLASEEGFFDTRIDRIGTWENPQHQALLIVYPLTEDRAISVEPVRRHYQQEAGLFQTWTGWLAAGDIVPFVTVLWPHDRGADVAEIARGISLLPVSHPTRAIAVRLEAADHVVTLGCRLDLDLGLLSRNVRPRYDYDAGKVSYGPFESDATHVYADLSTHHLQAAFTEGTRLVHQGQALYQADGHRMFQEDRTDSSTAPSWRKLWQQRFAL
ncbi:MAG: hypothetical protein JXC32_07270 [Anaerolineae bacterium]|nr:hypothetical protein [Anaerolineae bacterium]